MKVLEMPLRIQQMYEDTTPEVEFEEADSSDSAIGTIEELQQEMVVIERFGYTPMGTFGRARYQDFQAYSVERPWENNQPFISCIPVGVYKIRPTMYYGGDGPGGKKDYPAYKILSVPNRTHIKIHIANTMDDLFGCIAFGKHLGFIDKRWAVVESRLAFRSFMDEMEIKPAAFVCIKNLVGKGEWVNP